MALTSLHIRITVDFSTRIIGIVDMVGLKLVVQQEATILTKSVAIAVKTVDGTNFQQTSFSIPDPNNVQVTFQ